MNKKVIALLASLILTAGCQQQQLPAAASSTPTQENISQEKEASSASTAVKPDKVMEAEPTVSRPLPAAESEQKTASAQLQTAKLYKMNPKSYDIVPIDPSLTDKKVVLLTFDDGPKEHDMLESILQTLDKHHAKAIFFVNGYRVKQKPELLKLILDHGQTIGNHSWDHIDLKKESKEKIAQQIEDVQKIVKDTTGVTPVFFRPPFGSGGDAVRAKVQEQNMLFMTWSNGSLDWEMSSKSNNPDKIISNVLDQLRPGSNILMHELPWTDKALDKLLSELEAKQYGFVDPASIELLQ